MSNIFNAGAGNRAQLPQENSAPASDVPRRLAVQVAPPAGTRRGRDADDFDINVFEYLLILWRYRLIVIAGTLVCALAAYAVSSTGLPVYEATTTLVVRPAKTGDASPAVGSANFRALLESQSLASQIITQFGLDKPPYNLTSFGFTSRVLSVEEVRNTNLIRVRVRLTDPALSAKVVNGLAQSGVQSATQLNQNETVAERDFIKVQLDQATERWQKAQEALLAKKKEVQIDLLQKDAEAILDQRTSVLGLLVQIETEKARLARAEQELANQERIRTTRRVVDPRMRLSPSSEATNGPADVLEFRNESLDPYVNPVYESLEQQVAMSRATLAGLEKQKAELVDVRHINAAQLPTFSNLYAREIELGALQIEHDLAKTIYTALATQYEQARIRVAASSTQLQIFDPAVTPDRPVSPRPLRSTVFGALVGLFVTVLAALLINALRSRIASGDLTA